MTIEDILKVLYGIIGIWLGLGGCIHSSQYPERLGSKIFMFSMINLVIGIVIVAETLSPGSVGTVIKSIFINQ